MRALVVIIVFLSFLPAMAQDFSAREMIDRLNADGTVPDDIRSGKSLLLISCDSDLNCENWTNMAADAQSELADAGVDAVATYYFEDILSGVDPYRIFMEEFKDRQITHLVLINHSSQGYTINLTEFNEKEFIAEGQKGWQTQSPELREALNQANRAVSNSGQRLRNFLILDQPEYGEMIDIFTGRRAEFYDLNFSSDKLAVYPFADTAVIREVMASYPYEYEIIDPSIQEKELRSEGFEFVLYYVHTRAENTKKLLGYEVNDKETSFVSEAIMDNKPVLTSYPKDRHVYKFYIKHVYSGNIFLGKKWDASPEWDQALANYISLLRNDLLKN